MALASGAWAGKKKMSSWADESEAADAAAAAAAVIPPPAAAPPEDAFPSLEQAAKPGKKKNKMSLAEFTTGKVVGPGGKRSSSSTSSLVVVSDEIMFLPTGPKDRSQEEPYEQRLGGGFRGYGGGRAGGDRDFHYRHQHPSRDPDFAAAMAPPPPPSRADESNDWMSGKQSMPTMPRTSSRGVGSDRDLPSKADEVDDWNAGKKPVQPERSYGYGGGEQSWGGGGGRRGSSERWSFRDPMPEMDRWSGVGERRVAMERPRLNLQPRSIPVDPSSRPSSSHSSRPGTPASGDAGGEGTTASSKPRSNPFGAARPREMVLEERGQDWRKFDLELDQKRFESKELMELREEITSLKQRIDKENTETARAELEKKELEVEQLVRDLERKARVSESRRGGRDDRRPPSSHSNRGGGGAEIWKRPPTPAMSDTSSNATFDTLGGWRRDGRPGTPASMHDGETGGGYRRAENGGRPRTPGFHEDEWRRSDQSWRDDRPKSGQADMWSRPRTPSVPEDERNGRRSNYRFHDHARNR